MRQAGSARERGRLALRLDRRRTDGLLQFLQSLLPGLQPGLRRIAMQVLATGTVGSLAEARAIIEQSFPVERFDPVATDRWTSHYQRMQEYMEVMGV